MKTLRQLNMVFEKRKVRSAITGPKRKRKEVGVI